MFAGDGPKDEVDLIDGTILSAIHRTCDLPFLDALEDKVYDEVAETRRQPAGLGGFLAC